MVSRASLRGAVYVWMLARNRQYHFNPEEKRTTGCSVLGPSSPSNDLLPLFKLSSAAPEGSQMHLHYKGTGTVSFS